MSAATVSVSVSPVAEDAVAATRGAILQNKPILPPACQPLLTVPHFPYQPDGGTWLILLSVLDVDDAQCYVTKGEARAGCAPATRSAATAYPPYI